MFLCNVKGLTLHRTWAGVFGHNREAVHPYTHLLLYLSTTELTQMPAGFCQGDNKSATTLIASSTIHTSLNHLELEDLPRLEACCTTPVSVAALA